MTDCELWRAQSRKVHGVKPAPLYDDYERDRTWCSTKIVSGPRWQGKWDHVTCGQCCKQFDQEPARERWYKEGRHPYNSANWWTDYNDYLQSEHWAVIRHMVMTLYDWQCQECGDHADHVHHLFYPRGVKPGSKRWITLQKPYHLVPVCRSCHDKVHGRTFWPSSDDGVPTLPKN